MTQLVSRRRSQQRKPLFQTIDDGVQLFNGVFVKDSLRQLGPAIREPNAKIIAKAVDNGGELFIVQEIKEKGRLVIWMTIYPEELDDAERWSLRLIVDGYERLYLPNGDDFSLLVKLERKNRYLFVGSEIFAFSLAPGDLNTKTVSFNSDLGNSSIVYSQLVTDDHVYFLERGMKVSRRLAVSYFKENNLSSLSEINMWDPKVVKELKAVPFKKATVSRRRGF